MENPRERRRRRSLKPLMRSIHKWTGLLAGLIFAVLGLSGTILVFEPEIRATSMAQSTQANERPADFEVMESGLESAFPAHDLFALQRVPATDAPLFRAYLSDQGVEKRVVIDGASGRIVADESEPNWWDWVLELHTVLLGGAVGGTINFVMGGALVVSLLSGLVIWWPAARRWKAALTVNAGSPERLLRDLHGVLGSYSAIAMLPIAITGVVLLTPVTIDYYFNTDLRGREISSQEPAGRASLEVGEVAQRVREAMGDGKIDFISAPVEERGAFRLYYSFDGIDSASARGEIFVDRYTGDLIVIRDDRKRGVLSNLAGTWAHSIHDGRMGGLAGRILVALSGLVLAGLFITGFWFWLRKQQKQRAARNRTATLPRSPRGTSTL